MYKKSQSENHASIFIKSKKNYQKNFYNNKQRQTKNDRKQSRPAKIYQYNVELSKI